MSISDGRTLDNVDFGRQIRGHFQTDFLLANGRLHPSFHDVLHQVQIGV